MTQMLSQPIFHRADLADSSLVGSWLSPATPSSGKDASPAGNDGTPANIAWEEVGGGFNGTSSQLGLGAGTFDLSNDFTFSIWAETNIVTATGAYLFSQATLTPTRRTYIVREDDDLLIQFGTGSIAIVAEGVFVAEKILKIDLVYDASETEITTYVDGETTGISYTVAGLTASTGTFYIGRAPTAAWWNGDLYCAEMYTEAKTASWSKYNFLAGIPEG